MQQCCLTSRPVSIVSSCFSLNPRYVFFLQQAAGTPGKPVLRIVSLNADNTNRGHAFDMDMTDLEKDGKPLPYAEARSFFKADPSQRCAPHPQHCTLFTILCLTKASPAPARNASKRRRLQSMKVKLTTLPASLALYAERMRLPCNFAVSKDVGLPVQLGSLCGGCIVCADA